MMMAGDVPPRSDAAGRALSSDAAGRALSSDAAGRALSSDAAGRAIFVVVAPPAGRRSGESPAMS
ncbi:hypothetical protein F511_47264 [Dorcoceras hygrometricum]|uniref:Uncharacterized protein n=1 Tax=Dorcoceras hygrometricum TaxID=472368 RepID=A0A2Z6ZYQ0_9LAMI|nr:hypothetical protein F511_47264 [Dorcoceras hygrometricum]